MLSTARPAHLAGTPSLEDGYLVKTSGTIE